MGPILEYLAAEIQALRNEISDLKARRSKQQDEIDEAFLANGARLGISSNAERATEKKMKHILKAEKQVHVLENHHLIENLRNLFEHQHIHEIDHKKQLKVMHKDHFKEIQKIASDNAEKLHSQNIKVKKIEHEIRVEKQLHIANVKSLENKIRALRENRS